MAEDLTFLTVAYIIAWTSIFVYMLWLHFEHRRLGQEVDLLKEVVDGK
jgi:CcmD family protein